MRIAAVSQDVICVRFSVGLEIDQDAIDWLLGDHKGPEDLIGEQGQQKQMTWVLAESGMQAELTYRFGWAASACTLCSREKNWPPGSMAPSRYELVEVLWNQPVSEERRNPQSSARHGIPPPRAIDVLSARRQATTSFIWLSGEVTHDASLL